MHNPKIEEAAAKYLDSIGPDAHWRRGDVIRHLVAFAEEQIAAQSFGLGAEPVAGQHQNASGDNHAANVPASAGKTPDEASNYEKRLMSATMLVVRAENGYTISASDNLPGAIKELAAILAEQDARIEALEDVAHTPSEQERGRR